MKGLSHEFPKSGRVRLTGYAGSDDGLVQGVGSQGKEFVLSYEHICRKNTELKARWIQSLCSLGVKAAHPDDGWHNRESNSFGMAYPYFDDGISIGDMVALGEPSNFVIVIVESKSGLFSTKWHYKSTIH